MRGSKFVSRANEEIRIEDVLNDFFGGDVPYNVEKMKTYCPLGYDHSDGGIRKAMNVYSSTNSAWCFSHSMGFTPVSLWSLKTGLPQPVAAKKLLQEYGRRVDPPSLEERWIVLDEKASVPELDREALRRLIINHAKSLEGYGRRQYDESTLSLMSDILRVVDKLPSDLEYGKLEKLVQGIKGLLDSYWIDMYGKESHD